MSNEQTKTFAAYYFSHHFFELRDTNGRFLKEPPSVPRVPSTLPDRVGTATNHEAWNTYAHLIKTDIFPLLELMVQQLSQTRSFDLPSQAFCEILKTIQWFPLYAHCYLDLTLESTLTAAYAGVFKITAGLLETAELVFRYTADISGEAMYQAAFERGHLVNADGESCPAPSEMIIETTKHIVAQLQSAEQLALPLTSNLLIEDAPEFVLDLDHIWAFKDWFTEVNKNCLDYELQLSIVYQDFRRKLESGENSSEAFTTMLSDYLVKLDQFSLFLTGNRLYVADHDILTLFQEDLLPNPFVELQQHSISYSTTDQTVTIDGEPITILSLHQSFILALAQAALP